MINIIYWSGTGNTKVMAELIEEGIKSTGKSAQIIQVSDATVEDAEEASLLVLGCPSMGAEELDDYEMEPYVERIEKIVAKKRVALFGSYGWGSGEWMDIWEARMKACGADIVGTLIVNEMPEGKDVDQCVQFGKDIVA